MTSYRFTGKLAELICRAERGKEEDIDYLMSHLTGQSSLEMTRYVDYALSRVVNKKGIERIVFYLFNGTQIQRNYCSLYFNRNLDYELVKRAYKEGLIDEIQAYAR